MSQADVQELEKSVIDEVEDAVKFADESPKPVSIHSACFSLCPWSPMSLKAVAVAHAGCCGSCCRPSASKLCYSFAYNVSPALFISLLDPHHVQ